MSFEWDGEKAKRNLEKHGISFIEASSVFDDPYSITIDNPLHSKQETRYLEIGYSDRQRLLVVVLTERESNIRIISARIATPSERRMYEQGI